jgi:branched-chain amino acid transport system permease protein
MSMTTSTDAPRRIDRRQAIGVAVLVVLFALPLVPGFPPYWVTILNNIGLASLVAIGLVLLTGVGGLTSFGQAAFCGFGAYTTAVLCVRYGWSPWLTLPAVLVVTATAAVPLGLITMRLSGHFLPVGTIAWGIGLYYLFGRIEFLGRYDGIAPVPPFRLFGHAFFDPQSIFYVIWICVLLAVIAARNLLDSRTGRAIRALRGGAAAAQSSGVDIARAKLTIFTFAALLAGVSGWLYAHMQRAVNPTPFGLEMGIEYLLMAVAGGAGYIWGGVFGAALIVILNDILQRILPWLLGSEGNYEVIVFGVLLVLVLQFARGGLWPWVLRLFPESGSRKLAVPDGPLPRRAAGKAGSAVLEIQDARKVFGGLVAVNDVSFSVKPGEIMGLIGPNGAGKSTIFNLITGVLMPTGGRFIYRGEALKSGDPEAAARQGIARTFQHVKILPGMTVLENAALGAHLRGSSGVVRSLLRLDRAEEAQLLAEAAKQLDRVGLGAYRDRPASVLALGQSRILEIARALCLDPEVLLLDEPAAGLRFQEKQELAALLRRLRDEGMSILLVEHDVSFVMSLTNHIVVVDFGTKIAEGRPEEIRKHPAVIEAYLGGVA